MNSTFYNGIAGVKTHQFGIDSWSNNIANISTNGYKAQLPEFSTIFATTMQGLDANSPISNDKGYGATRSANGIDMTVGSFALADESPLNMALSGQSWFVVGNKNGSQISYTRDGAFSVDGNSIRAEDGTIISNSGGFIVNNSGQYLYGIDLNRVNGTQFSTDTLSVTSLNAGLNSVTDVNDLTPLQIPENLTYPPQATTQVYTALNLNPNSSLRNFTSAFIGYFPDLSTDMALFAGFQEGETLTINGADLTYGTDFTTIQEFLSNIQSATGLTGTYDNSGILTFINTTTAPIDTTFASSNANALTTLGLPATVTLASNETLEITPLVPLSTSAIFDEMGFRATDLNTLYKKDGTTLNLETGDSLTVTLNGVATTIVYGTDFRTVGELMDDIQSLSGLSPTIDQTNNALSFTNNTASDIHVSFTSSNPLFAQTLGLAEGATITPNTIISSSSLQVPSYRALSDVYDANGTKLLLSSTFTLASRDPQIWQMQSGVYDRQGEFLLSSEVVNGTLSFDTSGNLSSSSGFPASLTLPDGSMISYDPTRDQTAVDLESLGQDVSLLHQTTGFINMSSSIKQNDTNGNSEGYFQGLDIDQNGIISLSFSNDKFETFGRVGIAGFINSQGLRSLDNTLFQETANSGQASLLWDWGQRSGELRGTSVFSGRLEMSNVDLATALTEMMIYQRAYSASTKSITTADELIKEAIGLKK
jgi:flagellar hook protein FlgE